MGLLFKKIYFIGQGQGQICSWVLVENVYL